MSKATLVKAEVVTPPPVVQLVLSLHEAAVLLALVGSVGDSGSERNAMSDIFYALEKIPEVTRVRNSVRVPKSTSFKDQPLFSEEYPSQARTYA